MFFFSSECCVLYLFLNWLYSLNDPIHAGLVCMCPLQPTATQPNDGVVLKRIVVVALSAWQ